MLVLRPLGRGNWRPVIVAIEQSKHSPLPIEVHVGQRVQFGPHVFRVSKVLP